MSLFTNMMESCITKLQRPQVGRDSHMGTTYTFVFNLEQGIPCNLAQSSAPVNELYSQRNAIVSTTITLFQDIRAEPNDIIWAKDRCGNENCYLVEGSRQPQGRARVFMVDCRLILAPKDDPRMMGS